MALKLHRSRLAYLAIVLAFAILLLLAQYRESIYDATAQYQTVFTDSDARASPDRQSSLSTPPKQAAGANVLPSSSAPSLKENGSVPPANSTKAVVVPKLSREDTAWVDQELEGWQTFVYVVDDLSAPLHTPRNKGREGLAYLQFIIGHFEDLPDIVAFVHAHNAGYPEAWHTDNKDYSNALSLNTLNVSYIQEQGFANLRCNLEPGCPIEIDLRGVTSADKKPSPDDLPGLTRYHMPSAWSILFPNETIPEVIASPCCAQFAVSAHQIRTRPLEDYQRFYTWLLDTPLPDPISGRIMEHLWHVLFGRQSVFCPDTFECYCRLYGSQCNWAGLEWLTTRHPVDSS